MMYKKVLLGVSAGIAAYKSIELARLLIKSGCEVQVVATPGALEFISPLTFQAVTGNPLRHSLFDLSAEQGMGHIELARWADAMIIAPATADVIARLNAGMANDLLTTMVLASECPLYVAPAMNEKMWHNPLTQRNIDQLQQNYTRLSFLGPAAGEQACGDVGYGRMIEPSEIVAALNSDQPLKGKEICITAGPTREAIDPVRYISNHSSGKMGFALAQRAAALGAKVTLISGPVSLSTPAGVHRVRVDTAQEMLDAVVTNLGKDLFIACAAVADYRVETIAEQKIKKTDDVNALCLNLVKNPDILATIGKHPHRPELVVGFAAETENLIENARKKLMSKQADLIVANDVSQNDIGFNSDMNSVSLISHKQVQNLEKATKLELADIILRQIFKDYWHEGSL